MHFSDYLASVVQIYVVLGQCAPDYMDWFYMISYPFIRSTQPEDPPKHPLVMQDETYVELDMPEYPVVAAAMEEAPVHVPSDVEQPRHAVVTYIFVLFLISFNLIMQYGYTLFVVVNVIGGLLSNCRKVGAVA